MNNERFSTVCPCGSSGSVGSQAKQQGIQLIGGDNQISLKEIILSSINDI